MGLFWKFIEMNLKLNEIRIDGNTQSRAVINQDIVKEYSDAITDGANLPPVVVFYDGAEYWLADGFHRYHANNKIGAIDIDAEIKNGTQRDAVLFSVGVNATHGLRRTNADKRKAVQTLIDDDEWSKWSDREISRKCAVSNNFVSEIRKSSLSSDDSDKKNSTTRNYTTKHGAETVMETKNIGKSTNNQQKDKNKNKDISKDSCEYESFDQEKEEIHQELYGEEEIDIEVEIENAHKEIEKLTKIIELNDPLKEIKRLSDALNVAESQRDGFQASVAEFKRQVKYWKSKYEKLEKQVKNADLVNF